MAVDLYGARWSSKFSAEINAIRRDGEWWERQDENGEWVSPQGLGLFEHYKRLQTHLWPADGWDRWSELILRNIIDNRFTGLVGPNSSTKTHSVAKYIVTTYIVYPKGFCGLVSSTDSRSLELRVWGEIKKLWSEAKLRYPDTPGRIVESKQMIVTDIDDAEATDFRNGLLGVPCMVGGNYQGLSRYSGIKQGRIFLAADECQFMPPAYFDAIMTLQKNPEFKAAALGNPKDRTDTFGKLCEPASEIGGWEAYEPSGKTLEWATKFPGGKVLQLDGRDTPNNDFPKDEDGNYRYWYLINSDQIANDIAFHGEEDWHVYMNDYGIFPRDAQARRVITRLQLERFRAFEEPIWRGDDLVKLFVLDAAYGAVGGDRCIGIELCFGTCTDGKVRLAAVGNCLVIPVRAASSTPPEEQIAQWVMDYCIPKGIPPEHVAFDSTGRGSLMSAFARLWSGSVVAIEFGGVASDRPTAIKLPGQEAKIVPAKDYYFNFVSELWFAIPTLVESDQCRALPSGVAEEVVMRGWEHKARKIQIEPKTTDVRDQQGQRKPSFKTRLGHSPDQSDAFVVGIELAQRLGFVLGNAGAKDEGMPAWLEEEAARAKARQRRQQLVYH